MPYIIDSITAQTITVDGNPVEGFTYYNNETSGSATTINWSEASVQTVDLTEDSILTFDNARVGQKMTLILKQTQRGRRVVTWPNNVKWTGSVEPKLQSIGIGSFDDTFKVKYGVSRSHQSFNFLNGVAVFNDDKIIITGIFSAFDYVERVCIVKLKSDGLIDDTYVFGKGLNPGGPLSNTVIQPDNKVIVGGFFTQYNGANRNTIVRINANGTLDDTFVIGGGFNSSVRAIKLQNDGKIYVGGDYTSYSGISINRISRLSSNGSFDNTFSAGTGFNSAVFVIKQQTDNKLIVGGNFTTYNGVSANGIIRLNDNGSIDNSFNITSGFTGGNPLVNDCEIQTDGKIIAVGAFTGYSGTAINRLIRLNTDGTIDTSFNIGTGFNDVIYSVKLQSDNKILVGGQFTQYDGETKRGLVRLNTDGSLDTTFDIGDGLQGGNYNDIGAGGFNNDSSAIRAMSLQSDGKIIIVGSFQTYDNNQMQNVARINVENQTVYNTINFEYDGTNYIGSY